MLGPFLVKGTRDISLIEVNINPKDIKWDIINLYRDKFETLWKNLKDLKLNFISQHFHKNKNGFYEGGLKELPNEFRLKGLYLDFRPFHLKSEKISVQNFCDYIITLTTSKAYHNFINNEKEKFNSFFILEGWLKYKGQNVSANKIIELWFYSHYFHFNKINQFIKWSKFFSSETFQSLLFTSVYDSIMIIKNINWSISVLNENNLFLLIPKSFL